MALYRFEAKVISRGAGRSSVRAAAYRSGHSVIAAAAYRHGDRIANDNTGQVHDFSRKRGVAGAEIMLPAGAPAWMADRQQLWNAVEVIETRSNAQLARDFIISIPHELNAQQRREVVRDFVQAAFVSKGLPVDIAWHSPDRKGGLNHHAHVMMPFRVANENGLSATKLRVQTAPGVAPFEAMKAELQGLRVLWADVANRHLERAGLAVRIDHRSLADRGIDRLPEPKLGPLATHVIEKDGRMSKAGEDRRHTAELNAMTAEAKRDHARAVAAEGAVADLAAERDRRRQPIDLDQTMREQWDGQRDRLQAGARQLGTDEQESQQRNQQKDQLRRELKDQHERDAKAAREAAEERDAQARAHDGGLNSAAARYQIALGENYNINDPYGSMSRAAGAEHAAFIRQQEELKQAAFKEKDPLKKQLLENRREIESADYMFITSERLSGISVAIAGDRNAPQAVRDRDSATFWQAHGLTLREERNQLLEQQRKRDAAQQAKPRPNEAGRSDGPSPLGGGSPPPGQRQQLAQPDRGTPHDPTQGRAGDGQQRHDAGRTGESGLSETQQAKLAKARATRAAYAEQDGQKPREPEQGRAPADDRARNPSPARGDDRQPSGRREGEAELSEAQRAKLEKARATREFYTQQEAQKDRGDRGGGGRPGR